MARAYAARLGCIAMIFEMIKQCLNGGELSSGVWNGLSLLVIFAMIGFAIGATTESVIRQSLEANFRKKVENYRMQAKSTSTRTT
jgi:hypothetical protein